MAALKKGHRLGDSVLNELIIIYHLLPNKRQTLEKGGWASQIKFNIIRHICTLETHGSV